MSAVLATSVPKIYLPTMKKIPQIPSIIVVLSYIGHKKIYITIYVFFTIYGLYIKKKLGTFFLAKM